MKLTDKEKKVKAVARIINKSHIVDDVSISIPWRINKTPYRIFLAEFLLIRTRTDVVARCFDNLTTLYPNITSLAFAEEMHLANLLAPLGLRKRVPTLIKAAKYIRENFGGKIPKAYEDLVKIPGYGPYTATAVSVFAYNATEVPADVNILRFLSRITGIKMVHPTKGSDELRQLLPQFSSTISGLSAEKLLDFSRLICRPSRPKCNECPAKKNCSYPVLG